MIILVVDGYPESRLMIKNQLKNVSGIKLILECNSAEEALFIILEKGPLLIIASNILPGKSGLELANLLNKIECKSRIIILSNNNVDAIEAIRAKVFDFLVYPFSDERFAVAVEKALSGNEIPSKTYKHQGGAMKVKLSVPKGFSLIDLDLLSHCVADGSYTNLFFTTGKVECSSYYLGKLEEILKEYQFVRINRSVIINMRMLKNIDDREGICRIDTGNEIIDFRTTKLFIKNMVNTNFI